MSSINLIFFFVCIILVLIYIGILLTQNVGKVLSCFNLIKKKDYICFLHVQINRKFLYFNTI